VSRVILGYKRRLVGRSLCYTQSLATVQYATTVTLIWRTIWSTVLTEAKQISNVGWNKLHGGAVIPYELKLTHSLPAI